MRRKRVREAHGQRGARGHFPVSVIGVAVPEHAVWGLYGELRIDHREAVDNVLVVGGLDPKTCQLEEPSVSPRTLVDAARTAITEAIRSANVGIAVLRDAHVIWKRAVRPVLAHRPLLQLRAPGVSRSEVALRGSSVAVDLRNVGRANQASDLAGDRRRGIAVLLFPPLLRCKWCGVPLWRHEAYEEVGRRLDVPRPGGCVLSTKLVCENDRVGYFVQLQAVENGRAVDLGILGEGAVGLLLDIKNEVQGAAGAGQVPLDDERRHDFVEVARPYRMVESRGINYAGPKRPRHCRGGDKGPPLSFVLTSAEHHRRNCIQLAQILIRKVCRRIAQRVQVLVPTLSVFARELIKSGPQRIICNVERRRLSGGKTERECEMLIAPTPGQG